MKQLIGGIRGTLSLTPAGRALRVAMDAEFKESDHPRANNGQFGSGGGSGGSKSPSVPQNEEREHNRSEGGKAGNIDKIVAEHVKAGKTPGQMASAMRAAGYSQADVSEASIKHKESSKKGPTKTLSPKEFQEEVLRKTNLARAANKKKREEEEAERDANRLVYNPNGGFPLMKKPK